VKLCVVREPWRAHPLAWIHRAEAAAVAAELRAAGHAVSLANLGDDDAFQPATQLLRVSDPVMLSATRSLTAAGIPYIGPRATVMARCYDKYEACRLAAAQDFDVPATALASEAGSILPPLVVKPRRGSDSLGVRFPRRVASRYTTTEYIVQRRIHGADLTVAALRGHTGAPLRILLPEGTPYSFTRKYLLRPRRAPLADPALAERVRDLAGRIAALFDSDWAARVDFILESGSGRLCFLECDVAPLIGQGSAFTDSLAAAGMERAEQLRLLLEPAA
jgi:D-alanine-D-alanine ligase-like ATP-grasp enzyme